MTVPSEPSLADELPAIVGELAAAADGERARAMAAYMRDQFEFFGVGASARREISKRAMRTAKRADAADLIAFADAAWSDRHRELQYVACDALRAGAGGLGATDLPAVRRYLTTKPWWDTVDALAAHVVGPMAGRFPTLVASMDEWIDGDDLWLARTAILHQLRYRERTDARRLFDYCDRRAGDREFFIRKAIGWALREHARVDAEAVRAYVASRGARLSPLTRREATKHL